MKQKPSAMLPLVAAFFSFVMANPTVAWDTAFDIGTGYRVDKLNWTIAADRSGGATPNILSELAWDHLSIAQVAAGLKSTRPDGLELRASLDYGWIVNGRNRDSDFAGNNRTDEWSRSENDTDGDGVLDVSAAVGQRLGYAPGEAGTYLTPLIGYSHHRQNLRLTNGNQTVSRPELAPPDVTPPPVGPFPGLNSTYRTRWTGPWIGAEFFIGLGGATQAFVRVEQHWAHYYAEANWNLRAAFAHPKSFEQIADGTGRVLAVGLSSKAVVRDWTTRVTFHHQKWATDPGIDRVFFSDGTIAATRLNEVEWQTRAIALGFERRF